MPLDGINQILLNNKDTYIEQLFTLLKQKSISTQNEGILECANLLKSIMMELGISTRIIKTDGHPVVYGEIIKDQTFFTLLVYGHYDVQPVEPYDEWLSHPFEPTIRDGRIFGRGAGDNKRQLMAGLLGVRTYLEMFGDLPINIKFLFEGEEELGSPNLASFVKEHKELLKADLVYTSDGSSHSSGAPLLLLGARGCLDIELRAKGADFENHSGNTGNIIPNPAWKLIQLLNSMRDEDGRVLIEGFYDHILPPSQLEKELMKQLPFDGKDIGEKIGYDRLDMDAETYYHQLTMEPTFNINGLQSGFTGEGMKTIIPSTATVNRYAKKVKAGPTKSLVYDLEQKQRENTETINTPSKLQVKHYLIILTFMSGIGLLIWGVITKHWYLEQMAALFLAMGIIAGIFAGFSSTRIAEEFVEGAKSVTLGALIVGIAMAITVALKEGQIIDSLINGMAGIIMILPDFLKIISIYLFQGVINFFISSSSGQASVTMPIMVPLGELVGITRQTTVLSFHLGDGFTNLIYPTGSTLMAYLATAGIGYDKWVRFIWPLVAILLVIGAVFVVFAQIIQY